MGMDINKTKMSAFARDGLFELRTRVGTNIDRIFYFFISGNKIIMTNAYLKKDEKMDPAAFKRAQDYRDMYLGKGKYSKKK